MAGGNPEARCRAGSAAVAGGGPTDPDAALHAEAHPFANVRPGDGGDREHVTVVERELEPSALLERDRTHDLAFAISDGIDDDVRPARQQPAAGR